MDGCTYFCYTWWIKSPGRILNIMTGVLLFQGHFVKT